MGALRARHRTLVVEWDETRDDPPTTNHLCDAIHHRYKDMGESRP